MKAYVVQVMIYSGNSLSKGIFKSREVLKFIYIIHIIYIYMCMYVNNEIHSWNEKSQ